MSPWKGAMLKGSFIFQPSIFRGGMLFHEVEVEDLPEVFFAYCLANPGL